MKVLHVLSSNKYSGAENVVCQIIKMFDGDVEMAYCSPDGDIRETLKRKDIKYFALNKLSVKEITKVVDEYKPDIVHAHDLRAICNVAMLKRAVKKIGHIHVNDKSKMSKLSLKSIVLRVFGKKFSHLFWVSNSCFEDFKFKNVLRKNSSVLYNIINEKNLREIVNQDEDNYDYDIVYLGRLTYQKHPERLIEIAKQLKSKKEEFKMAIIGGGDLADEIKQLIKSEQLENNVFYLGFMNNAYKLLSQAQLMLMTSRFEGTPMVALESISLGVPIVTTKTDGMLDLITNDKNGYLYDTNEQAVEQILKLLTQQELRAQMKEECVKFSAEYNNIEKYKKEIINAYMEQK